MLDLNQPVQLRSGVAATIVATGVMSDIPGVGSMRLDGQTVLAQHADDDSLHYHFPNGGFISEEAEDQEDLVNVPAAPVVVERFANVYPGYAYAADPTSVRPGLSAFFPTKEEADAQHGRDVATRGGVLKLTFTDGKLSAATVA